jgi:hypothetical protein
MDELRYARISGLDPIDRDPLDSDLLEIETGQGGSGYMSATRFKADSPIEDVLYTRFEIIGAMAAGMSLAIAWEYPA